MDTIWEFYETPVGPRPIHPVRNGRIPAQGHRRRRVVRGGYGLLATSWSRRIRVAFDWAVGVVLPRDDIADLTEVSRGRKGVEEHA
jgi:hypothetical protein